MNITEQYFETMRTLAKTPIEYRVKTFAKLLQRDSVNIAKRNRYLYDAVHLLKGDWEENPSWRFTRIGELAGLNLDVDVPQSLSDTLSKAIEQSKQLTPESFAQLQQQSPQRFDDEEKYLEWFYRNTPYLVLDLPGAYYDGLAEAQERLRWFLSKIPDSSSLKEVLLDYGIRCIFGYLSTTTAD